MKLTTRQLTLCAVLTAMVYQALPYTVLVLYPALVRLDPAGFAARELADRREAGFPPAIRLVSVEGPAAAIAQFQNHKFTAVPFHQFFCGVPTGFFISGIDTDQGFGFGFVGGQDRNRWQFFQHIVDLFLAGITRQREAHAAMGRSVRDVHRPHHMRGFQRTGGDRKSVV